MYIDTTTWPDKDHDLAAVAVALTGEFRTAEDIALTTKLPPQLKPQTVAYALQELERTSKAVSRWLRSVRQYKAVAP